MIRVLLADDHPVVTSGYLRLLEQAGGIDVVAQAHHGEAAYAAYLATNPDVLVTDLAMPRGGGLELIRRRAGVSEILCSRPVSELVVVELFSVSRGPCQAAGGAPVEA